MYQRYLHLTGVPAYRTPDGRLHMDELAARDLRRHTYIAESLRVVCPVLECEQPPAGTVPYEQDSCEFVGLPHASSLGRYVVTGRWLRAVRIMWQQLAWPDVAFVGFVEHPIPYGWTAAPFAAMRHVPWYTFIESTPWRIPAGAESKWRQRVRAAIAERLNRLFFRRAAFAFVSQPAYAEFLRPGCPFLVSPASWFLRAELAAPEQIAAARSRAPERDPHLMYVGRLDPSKGVAALLAALRRVDSAGCRLTFTVLGAGQLHRRVRDAVATLRHVTLELRQPVAYGPEFFEQLRSADALVVTNLGDEQPRIIFDAFSQAVPVLAFATSGVRSVVTDGVDGRLVAVGDDAALAAAIESVADPTERARWHAVGDAGHVRAAQYDHDEMHAQRSAFVASLAV